MAGNHKKRTEPKNGKSGIQFGKMQWAMFLFGLMIVALLVERRNVGYDKTESGLEILEQADFTEELLQKKVECLVLWDSKETASETAMKEMSAVLSQMKITFTQQDWNRDKNDDFGNYRNIVLALKQFSGMGESIFALFDWVRAGGNLQVVCLPENDSYLQTVGEKMGIRDIGNEYYRVEGLRFRSGFMIGGEGRDIAVSDPFESALTVTLDKNAAVHIVSADEVQIPLVWSYEYGEGTVVVDNLDYFEKAYRGFYAASYSLLDDVCVWPVINGSSFYIDDFPSPVPTGDGGNIREEYNMDIKTFYTNIWWPDIEKLSQKYGIRYTGMVIENYSDENRAPFEGNDDLQRFRYFGNKLLDDGGEIGLHGYNHMPLVLQDFDYKGQFDTYKQWKSEEDIRLSLQELNRFCSWIFPKEKFQVYVPPSNILSAQGRKILKEDFPQLKAIAGIYFPGEFEYTQDFTVAKDGMIETPRIISGYRIDPYMEIAAISELNFHYVNSHFQHPDDILDPDRGADLGWKRLGGRLAEYAEWLYTSAPDIRNLTGSEMAGAVQRYYNLDTRVIKQGKDVSISLSNFQDDAWLFVRVNDGVLKSVEGGEAVKTADGLYLLKVREKEMILHLA